MSWKAAGELVRDRAAAAREVAARHPVPAQQVRELQRDLNREPVSLVWLMNRLAQELDAVAVECDRRGAEDVTVSGRGPRG